MMPASIPGSQVAPGTGRRETVAQGILAGLIGFATVVIVLAIVNLLAGQSPFYTAALLGNALFYGVEDPLLASVSSAPILAYSVLHLIVFILFGILAAALAALADRGWQLWFVALFFFILFSFHLYAAVQGIAIPMRAALSGATIWAAGAAASLMMAWYLIRAHPRIRATQSW